MTVVLLRGAKEAPKSVSSKMDTILITPEVAAKWLCPPFQRPLKVNGKVRTIAEELKHNGGIISGILTLGCISREKSVLYIVDGQHRIEAAKISELAETIADVRICTFDSMAEMAEEFVKLNSAIVRMNPDDILRGMEGSLAVVHNIKEACPFVGYENIRRGTREDSPVLSMSATLRMWLGARPDTPTMGNGSALSIASGMSVEDAEELIRFLKVARAAWGSEPQNYRLWTTLNLTICMWLWLRLVADKQRQGNSRYVVLSSESFKKCLMSVAASTDYVDWLAGRNLVERNRTPAYSRLKSLFVNRLRSDTSERNIKLPQPVWAN